MRYDNITPERSMYQCCKPLTEILEEIDPSENYRGTALEGLDAFSRQLKRFDIKVSGRSSDTVEKFFQSNSTSILFPEFVRRSVQVGMEENDMLHNIIASTTFIDGYDYRSVAAAPAQENELKVGVAENLCILKKRGRMLVSSYESLRFQRLDLFSTILKQIGAYICKAQFADAIDTLINGDGNNNAAQVIVKTRLSSDNILEAIDSMAAFTLNTIIASYSMTQKIIALPEYATQITCGADGVYHLPFNISLIASKAVRDDSIVCIDRNAALEMVIAGGLTVDYDRLIDRQLERASISCTAGFSKIYDGAVKRLLYD